MSMRLSSFPKLRRTLVGLGVGSCDEREGQGETRSLEGFLPYTRSLTGVGLGVA